MVLRASRVQLERQAQSVKKLKSEVRDKVGKEGTSKSSYYSFVHEDEIDYLVLYVCLFSGSNPRITEGMKESLITHNRLPSIRPRLLGVGSNPVVDPALSAGQSALHHQLQEYLPFSLPVPRAHKINKASLRISMY